MPSTFRADADFSDAVKRTKVFNEIVRGLDDLKYLPGSTLIYGTSLAYDRFSLSSTPCLYTNIRGHIIDINERTVRSYILGKRSGDESIHYAPIDTVEKYLQRPIQRLLGIDPEMIAARKILSHVRTLAVQQGLIPAASEVPVQLRRKFSFMP